MTTYRGSCHCGKVRFEVDAEIDHVRSCDCSICRRRGAVNYRVAKEKFRLLTPWEDLTLYKWGSLTAKDYFCSTFRIFGGPMLGIAVLNWMARNAEPSTARNAIVLANIVGFGCVTLLDVWGVFTGGARPIAKLFLLIHLLLTVAFVVAWRTIKKAERIV